MLLFYLKSQLKIDFMQLPQMNPYPQNKSAALREVVEPKG
jgi:hypothetical protein